MHSGGVRMAKWDILQTTPTRVSGDENRMGRTKFIGQILIVIRKENPPTKHSPA